jgi:ParB family transcriptional regulator, chromosome partitioning protein
VKTDKPEQQVIVSVNPFRCRMWSLHDRSQEHITEESCRKEILSFQRHGQLVPALARRLSNDPTHDFELIFGARRLFIARHLNVPLRVEIRDLADRDAFVAMDVENRQRQDISPYERGASYLHWLREGHFASQEDIASALKISTSQVSRLIKIARLPAIIVSAFESPTHIRESWALELAAALEDPSRRLHVIRKARGLASQNPKFPAREVCRRLLAASPAGRKPIAKSRDEMILGEAGTPLFRIRLTRTSIMLLLPSQCVSAHLLNEIRAALRSVLQRKERGTHEALDTVGTLTAPLDISRSVRL